MKYILRLISIILLLSSLNVSAQERKMLSVEDAMWNAQVGVRAFPAQQSGTLSIEEALMPIPGINRQMLSVEDALWNAQVGAMTMNYPAEQINNAMPYSQPFSAYQQPVRYVAAYAPPMYYAAPYPQQNQAFVNWLFGTPRREDAPADVAEPAPEPVHVAAAIAPQPTPKFVRAVEPTPQPTIAAAAESAITPPTIIQTSVMAAPTVQPPETAETTAAPVALTEPLPEPTLLTSAEYWTRKIILTGLLLIIMGFALYKDRAATRHTEQRASRQIEELEQELRRLDRLIYGDEQPGGRTP